MVIRRFNAREVDCEERQSSCNRSITRLGITTSRSGSIVWLNVHPPRMHGRAYRGCSSKELSFRSIALYLEGVDSPTIDTRSKSSENLAQSAIISSGLISI